MLVLEADFVMNRAAGACGLGEVGFKLKLQNVELLESLELTVVGGPAAFLGPSIWSPEFVSGI